MTGQIKTETLHDSDMAIATAYPQEQVGDKCEVILERFNPEDIGGFVLTELAQDPGLCEKILEQSGMDVRDVLDDAQSVLRQDEQEMQNALDRIEEALDHQDNNMSSGDIWEQQTPPPVTSTTDDDDGDMGNSDPGNNDPGGSDPSGGGTTDPEPELGPAPGATVIDSGTCGSPYLDDVTWTLYSDGTMVISGTGAMQDYNNNETLNFVRHGLQIRI